MLGGKCVFVDSYPDFDLPVEKIVDAITDKTKLIIIPHGQLYYIPFEALAPVPIQESDFSWIDYLIKHYSFSYHYSANLWFYNTRYKKSEREKSFIGFAPVFSEKQRQGMP